MGRLEDVVEEASDILDLLMLDFDPRVMTTKVIYRKFFTVDFTGMFMRPIKSVKKDYLSILKMCSPSRTGCLRTQSAVAGVTSSSRNSRGSSIKIGDEIVVGLDDDVDLIKGKLAEDTKKLDIVSIVGMGGIGKTTLANKVFNDDFASKDFEVRGWITVSQTYEKTHLLNRLLASIGVKIDPDKRDNCSHLREKLHECLMDQRYLVVIDDIWNIKAWYDLKDFFPDHSNGSRLLLTSRHKIVDKHAKPLGFVHKLRFLTDEESWKLLQKMVFRGRDFSESLNAPGMQIARNCGGLPLALVVIAGVLAKERHEESWKKISRSGSSSVVSSSIVMETLALTLNHLPSHLRNCYLYLGGFPEDYRFGVTRLIWLWIAEGFIQEAENQSLEETAKDYLMELVDRNLVVVQDRKFDRAIKTFSVHDVLRELSSEIARKERISLQVLGWENRIIAPFWRSRLFMPLNGRKPLLPIWGGGIYPQGYSVKSYIVLKCSRSWRLLTVLDLAQCAVECFPENITLLVNLKYLAIRNEDRDFKYSTICDLKSLQTLIIKELSNDPLVVLPNSISNLVNLRHLQSSRAITFPPLQKPLMNLQTVSNVVLGDEPTSLVNYFPGVKKLSCSISLYGDQEYDLKSLTFLEILKISSESIPRLENTSMIRFPASLKKLTLNECHLPWSFMSEIQSLPNLEVLKLLTGAFVGPQWDAGEEPFQQLKFLKLSGLDIKQWEASSINFPCLERLVLDYCDSLDGIPLDIGFIQTLEVIEVVSCRDSVIESAYEIKEEQHADGHDLKIIKKGGDISGFDFRKTLMLWALGWDKLWNDTHGRNTTVRTGISIKFGNTTVRTNDASGSNTKVRTGISIKFLTPQELQTLGLPINHPPPAHHHIRRERIWNDDRSKNRPIKRKNFKGVRY